MSEVPNTKRIYGALAAAQGKLKNPEKTKEAVVKGKSKSTGRAYEMRYKYADIADVLNAVRPILAKEDLAVAQHTRVSDNQYLFVDTILYHGDGGSIKSEFPVCPVVADQQKMGGSLTYARRYALCALLGIAAEEDIDRADQVAEDFESGKRQAPPLGEQKQEERPAGKVPDFPAPDAPAEVKPVTGSDEDIRAWATPFANTIKKAPSATIMADWFDSNKDHIEHLAIVAPKLSQRLTDISKARVEALAKETEEASE